MSGSHDKKARARQRAEGTERRQLAAQKQTKTEKRRKIRTTIIAAAVVVFIAAVLLISSNLFYNASPAISIGGRNVTAAEFNYFYIADYQQMLSSYGDYASLIGLDSSKPLNQQICPFPAENGKEQTWAKYFKNDAISQIKTLVMVEKAAKEAGFSMSDESSQSIEAEIASVESTYSAYGFSSAEQFLQYQYGKGFNIDTLRSVMTLQYLAGDYYTHKMESFEFTQDEYDAYYAEHAAENDLFTYRAYTVYAETDEEDTVSEEAMTAAKAAADLIAAAKTEEEFAELVEKNAPEDSTTDYSDETATLATTQGTSLSSLSYGEWLQDASRKAGDISAFEEEGSGYSVVMFVSRDDNSYNLREVRHILIKAVADAETGEYTDEAKETAKARADEILAEWEDGDATEDSFAELANEYSEDGGSNENGGFYGEIYKNQMVQEFNDFLFDESKKPGDTGVVYGESSSYAGYHVMYYVGQDSSLRYCDYIAREALKSDSYSEWESAQLANLTVKKYFPFILAGKQ